MKREFVFFSLAVTGTGISGGDRIFIELARNWSKKDEITIFTSHQGFGLLKKQKLSSVKIKVFTIPNKFLINNFLLDYIFKVFYGLYLAFKIKPSRNTYIYSSSEFLMDVLPAAILKIRNKNFRWVATWYQTAPNPFNGFSESNREKRYYFKALLYWLSQLPTKPLINNFASKIIVNNEDERKRFLNKETIVLIGAVPLQPIKQFLKKHGKTEKIYDAVFQGRFHPQKGVEELVDIWKIVVDKKPNAKLAMIGDGPLMKNVKTKINNLKLSKNIKLFSYLFDGNEKFKVFSQSKVVLHPAFYDSGGMASAEAMAFGLPCVGFDLVSYKSYYPKGMLKVKQNDLRGFAATIIRLLDNKRIYKNYSKEAKNLIEENYSWQVRSKQIYREIT